MILTTKIIILAILVLFSAFFSGSEIALFSLSRLKVKHLINKNMKGAKIIERLKSNPTMMLTTILIGNNVVVIGASALATSIVFEFTTSYAVSIATGLMTLIILVFGEIIPKSLAVRHNERFSLLAAKPLFFMQTVFFPIVIVFESFSRLFIPKREERPIVTEEELKTFVSVGEDIGEINELEKVMIHRIFRFDDLGAKDIMTPKKKMVCVSADDTIKEVAKLITVKKHTKIPVYRNSIDNIRGFIHILDLQKAMLNKKMRDKRATSIMKPVLFVSESRKLDSLLNLFKTKKKLIAIVRNKSSKTIGLVTLEDVLEEIVGEIMEEHEKIK